MSFRSVKEMLLDNVDPSVCLLRCRGDRAVMCRPRDVMVWGSDLARKPVALCASRVQIPSPAPVSLASSKQSHATTEMCALCIRKAGH